MKRLFEIDLHDYEANYRVFRRPSARGIILDGKKIALVYSTRENYYKFPGGGIRDDEDKIPALIREVKEEVGLTVIPDSIVEFGSVMRRQKSNMAADTIFEQENYYYFCKTEDQITQQHLDDYEKDAGFILKVTDIDEAILTNQQYYSDDYFDEIMIRREMMVLQLVRDTL